MSTTNESETPVRLALVGCGGISGAHVNGYKDLFGRGCREFIVTACCDVREESARRRAQEIATFQGTEPAIFTDQEELLKAGLADAADVCLPHCFHHSSALPLLDAGLHAMVEKPLGITIKASKQIIAAARRNQRVLATAENIRRYLTARACTWALTQKRLIGDVRLVNIQAINYSPFDYENPAMKWRGVKTLTGGGMIMDSGAHFADMIEVLFGDVDEVYCSMNAYDDRLIKDAPILGDARADVEDTWHAVIRFKSGLHVAWTHSRSLYGEPVSVANYYGSAGTMKALGFAFHPFQGGGIATLADGTVISNEQIQADFMASLSEEEKARLFPYGSTDGFAIEAWDFVNAIRAERKPEMDGDDGLCAKALCECCYESAITGQPVKFDDVISGKIDAYQRPIDEFWKIA
ncbi:MAG: Gfo/Idh/MocA family oxidoreductase [Chloroflexi bacterium]|nr:Gfo/Idh/MocA family oxidoreductase [Chloroflexota bacterium]